MNSLCTQTSLNFDVHKISVHRIFKSVNESLYKYLNMYLYKLSSTDLNIIT